MPYSIDQEKIDFYNLQIFFQKKHKKREYP